MGNLKSDSYPAEEQEIAHNILRYLQTHPAAKDTLEGIVQWWLLREWQERSVAKVERAVQVLLANDLLLETKRQGLPPFYGINPQRHKEISKILGIPGL